MIIPKQPAFLDERGAVYFRQDREKTFGKRLEDLNPDPDTAWTVVEEKMQPLIKLLNETTGPFYGGKDPIWADFRLEGILGWLEASKLLPSSSSELRS